MSSYFMQRDTSAAHAVSSPQDAAPTSATVRPEPQAASARISGDPVAKPLAESPRRALASSNAGGVLLPFRMRPLPHHFRFSRSSLVDRIRAISDPLALIFALFLAGGWTDSLTHPAFGVALLTCVALGVAPWTAATHLREASTLRVLTLWAIAVALVLAVADAIHQIREFPLLLFFTWLATGAPSLVLSHRLVDRFGTLLARTGAHTRTAAIVGANAVGHELARQFRDHPEQRTTVAGFFDNRPPLRSGLTPDQFLGPLENVGEVVKRRGIDVVFIALPMASQPRILRLLRELGDTTASIYFVPDIFISDLVQVQVSDVNGIPTLALCESPFDATNRLLKRLFDLIVASLIFVVALPVMALIAIAVKLDSPGPILFKQRRYGIDGREIVVYKFRSMTTLEDGERVPQVQRENPHVTRVGAMLRRLSLDELPQLFNVLQGRMSLVGPRPHAVAHNELYRHLIDGYMLRHKVLPGITGLAQIRGCRGETATVEAMRRRVRYDLTYLSNWSVQLDLYILFATLLYSWRDPASY